MYQGTASAWVPSSQTIISLAINIKILKSEWILGENCTENRGRAWSAPVGRVARDVLIIYSKAHYIALAQTEGNKAITEAILSSFNRNEVFLPPRRSSTSHFNSTYIKNKHPYGNKHLFITENNNNNTTPRQTSTADCVHVRPSSTSQTRKIVPISIYCWRDWVHAMPSSSLLFFHVFMFIRAVLPSTPLDLVTISWWERKCSWDRFGSSWLLILIAQHLVTVEGS